MSITSYFEWLRREPTIAQIHNVCRKMQGKSGLIGRTVAMTDAEIADLVEYIPTCPGIEAIWATVHEPRPEAADKTKLSKDDMMAYRYLAIDIDARNAHKQKVCATDDERAKTQATARKLSAMLMAQGMPRPLEVMSGNGTLLLFPLDLPYTDDNYALMEQFATVLADSFNTDDCDIDKGVLKDPSRILGVVGTVNRTKREVPEDGRYAKERVVIGEYPPNEPMEAEEFIGIANAIISEHDALTVDTATPAADTVCDAFNTIRPQDTVDDGKADDRVARCKAYLLKCPEAIDGSGGHNATLRAACECYRFGLSDGQAKEMMDWYNANQCKPSWTDAEIRHKLDDAYKAVLGKGEIGCRLAGASVVSETSSEPYPMTDVGNAEHFVAIHGNNLKYVIAWRKWVRWTGKRWAVDERGSARKIAVKHVRVAMPKYATTIKDDERRTRYLKWASQSQSESKIDSMLSLASTLLACEPKEFDADSNLFNVANGTIELDTQTFREHRREDLLIKISQASYDPDAKCPNWDAFIDRIFADAAGKPRMEVIEYVQRAAAYSMTAYTTAQCLFMLFGNGHNGKTTFVNGIRLVMGEYADEGRPSLLQKMSANVGHNSDDEADLFGLRMVSLAEIDTTARMDEAKVKRIVDTGNIRAMRKYQDSFEFTPTHKIWISCNHKPVVKNNDDGIWRRIKLIPFMAYIPQAEREEHFVANKLQPEASGILNWMLDGLRGWYADGMKLNTPREVSDAVSEYRADSDTFGLFLAERIEPNDAAKALVREVYAAYCGWADANGLTYTMSKIDFGRRMKERNYDSKPSGRERYYIGCSLLASEGVRAAADDGDDGDGLPKGNDTTAVDDDRPF